MRSETELSGSVEESIACFKACHVFRDLMSETKISQNLECARSQHLYLSRSPRTCVRVYIFFISAVSVSIVKGKESEGELICTTSQ